MLAISPTLYYIYAHNLKKIDISSLKIARQ